MFAAPTLSSPPLPTPPTAPSTSTVQCGWFNCTASFATSSELLPHLTKTHMSAHRNKHTVCRWGNLVCATHPASFASIEGLMQHVVQAHIWVPFLVCQWHACTYHSVSFAELTQHISRQHIGFKKTPYICQWNQCNKAFHQRPKCMRHILVHTGDKPYLCNLCSKRFTEYRHLLGHSRSHTGERPYACAMCPKTFTLNSSLTFHMKSSHRPKSPSHPRYTCNMEGCSKSYTLVCNLLKHQKGAHLGILATCPHCPKTFKRSDHVLRHLQKIHNTTP